MKIMFKNILLIQLLLVSFQASAADSYRFLHVTIDTPWMIFIFLLIIIFIPFILMAYLYWYYAFKKDDEKDGKKEVDVVPAEVQEESIAETVSSSSSKDI